MRLLKLSVIVCLLAVFSCKKDSDSADLTPRFYFINGGTSATAFARNLVLFSSADIDTVKIVVSSAYSLPKAVTVTLGVANEYITSYNTANGTNYVAMQEAAYDFETTFTAGDNSTVYDTIIVKLQKNLLVGDNYMLPIQIQSAGGHKIDTATSVIYLHTNENALSGIYSCALSKKLYNGDASGDPVETLDTTIGKSLIPLTSQSSLLDYADLGPNGWKYILAYGVDGGGFTVQPNNIMQTSIEPGSFKVLNAIYNPPSSNIYLKTSYKNLSGNERIVEETLTLQ